MKWTSRPSKLYLALIRHNRTGYRLDKGGFSSAVVTDHRKDFTGKEIEIGMIECRHPPVAFDQSAPGQDWSVAHTDTFLIH